MPGVHGRRKRAHAQPWAEEVPLFDEREKERLNEGFVGGGEVAVVGDGAAKGRPAIAMEQYIYVLSYGTLY